MKNHDIRRNRRRRRRDRYDQQTRFMWMYATVSMLSFASVSIGLAKAVFKMSENYVGPIMFFLLSGGLIVFGLTLLWTLFQRRNGLSTLSVALGAMAVLIVGINFGHARSNGPIWVDSVNPWRSDLARVQQNALNEEPDFLMIIQEKETVLGRFGDIPPDHQITNNSNTLPFIGERPEDFVPVFNKAVERWKHEKNLLGMDQEFTVRINVDRCTSFGRFEAFQHPLVDNGLKWTDLAVVTPYSVGHLRLPVSSSEVSGLPVVSLMPSQVEVFIPGELDPRVVECAVSECFAVSACGEPQFFDEVREILRTQEAENYALIVHPDVSMGSTVQLIDALSSSDGWILPPASLSLLTY